MQQRHLKLKRNKYGKGSVKYTDKLAIGEIK